MLALLAVFVLVAAGCGRDSESSDDGNGTANAATNSEEELTGSVQADGSSTVGPLTSAAAEL
ncbi:MAG TPA: hypothetical protein VK896_02035, partial [Gaiellaceae bacterium]|nr:hypothetical protein [Gaiellaceae bacterium]